MRRSSPTPSRPPRPGSWCWPCRRTTRSRWAWCWPPAATTGSASSVGTDAMICVLLLAAGEAWESPALVDLEAHPGVVVLKRCVDVDDLLASVTSGQVDVAVVSLDAPGLDPASVAHLRRHAVRPVAVTSALPEDLDAREHAG